MTRHHPHRAGRSGFTLVELMIVVVIIGILAALAIPRFSLASYKAKEREADLILSQVYRLQTAYRANTGSFATTEAELAMVGYAPPQSMKHYTWTGSVTLPLCLTATTGASNRQVDTNGQLTNC